jgi:hypothetical protein
MGDETAAGQQPTDDQAGTEDAGTEGSIYSGVTDPAQGGTEDAGTEGSIYSGETEDDGPEDGDDDGPPDVGSIYSG